jgi:aryl-alcohol dehydrogenase-like predicted oxidoreductase
VQKRRLGNTDLELTSIGIGTWAIGGGDWKFGWGAQDEAESLAAIVTGVQRGINWIDTAAVYGNGRAEEMVGQALRQLSPADRPYVATKCGRIILSDGNIVGRISRPSIMAECEASLRRLQVDCIDLYQLHWPDPDAEIELAWETMIDLKQAGKVRHIGVSNHSVTQMQRLQPIHPIASLQPPYSMIAREVETDILPYCGQQQIGVLCYSPLGKGLLTGAFTRERAASLPADDHRSRDPKFHEPLLGLNLALVDGLGPIATRCGHSLAELAIAWVLRRPEVTSAIVGARRPSQLEAVIGAADWSLASADQMEIENLLARRQAALDQLGPVDRGRV